MSGARSTGDYQTDPPTREAMDLRNEFWRRPTPDSGGPAGFPDLHRERGTEATMSLEEFLAWCAEREIRVELEMTPVDFGPTPSSFSLTCEHGGRDNRIEVHGRDIQRMIATCTGALGHIPVVEDDDQ